MYVHGIRYLSHEVHELDGYNHEFWKTSGNSLKFVPEFSYSRLNFTRESSFKDTPLDWTLVKVFEDLDFRLCLSVSRHGYDVYKHPDESETSLVCPKRVSVVETSLVWTRLVLDRARLIDNIDKIDSIDSI